MGLYRYPVGAHLDTPMRTTLLLLAVFAFGCHDYSIDPQPLEPVIPVDADYITLKGPGIVSPGDFPRYRAQGHAEAVRYRFQLTSPSTPVMQSVDSDDDRYFYAEVIGEGTVEVKVTVYDLNDEIVATSKRTVESR